MKKKVLIGVGVIFIIIGVVYASIAAGLLIALSPLSTLYNLHTGKSISGVVVSCDTGLPIAAAEVAVYGAGWGMSNGKLIWDKSYGSTTQTDSSGRYDLTYKLGTSLQTKKEGYLTAQNHVKNGDTVQVKLREITADVDPTELTFDCRLSSECYKLREEGDVIVGWNDCTNPR